MTQRKGKRTRDHDPVQGLAAGCWTQGNGFGRSLNCKTVIP